VKRKFKIKFHKRKGKRDSSEMWKSDENKQELHLSQAELSSVDSDTKDELMNVSYISL
jgi:hypothetical protein